MSEWLRLHENSTAEPKPTLFLLETPFQKQIPRGAPSRPPSSQSPLNGECEYEEELYGLVLLRKIQSEASTRNLSKLVITVPVVAFPEESLSNGTDFDGQAESESTHARMMRRHCIEIGAKAVVPSPMSKMCIRDLFDTYAYRAHLDAKALHRAQNEARKTPYAYLREDMVSKLANNICNGGREWDGLETTMSPVSAQRRDEIALAISEWAFCSPNFSDDELVAAACIIFEHALSVPELKDWRIPAAQLHAFIVACRAAYNKFVAYHNFCHVVDVLQATFHVLVEVGAFPPLRSANDSRPRIASSRSPIAKLLGPFEGLMLLVTAIGHDVGHPGVNNGFLVKLRAPLAQLYNDKSVLENFHCAAYTQILRNYWPKVYNESAMRTLVLSSILATDMSLHGDYMGRMNALKAALSENNGSTDSWEPAQKHDRTALTCALLIKCADISNVARKHDTAIKWMHTLSEECARQKDMESELKLDSSLMAYSGKDISKLTESQLNFMKFVAKPLFEGVAHILPEVGYCLDELNLNQKLFEQQYEQAKGNTTVVPNGHRESPAVGHLDAKPVNGIVTTFDSVADFAQSDPFSVAASDSSNPSKQRCSETTEGSSAPYTGDCASQATSATTGRMPLSPSTQGTSIVSRDSLDRPNSLPVTSVTAPDSAAPDSSTARADSTKSQTEFMAGYHHHHRQSDEEGDYSSNGHSARTSPRRNGGLESGFDHPDYPHKTVKKKTSRWESLKAMFKSGHKSSSNSSPPLPPADASG